MLCLTEAMLQGVPCMVSNIDGNNDVIYNGSNAFACNNLEKYTDTILSLINTTAQARQLGEAAKQYILDHHDLSKNIHKLEAIYKTFAAMK